VLATDVRSGGQQPHEVLWYYCWRRGWVWQQFGQTALLSCSPDDGAAALSSSREGVRKEGSLKSSGTALDADQVRKKPLGKPLVTANVQLVMKTLLPL
jgi:hypothetical protein